MVDQQKLSAQLAQYPLLQFAFVPTKEIIFSPRVRAVCRMECPMYGKSWSCPPAVGSLEACRSRCLQYETALMFATVSEAQDVADVFGTAPSQVLHECITREVLCLVQAQTGDAFALSARACSHCAVCAYPENSCRAPAQMFACVESHGIVVSAVAEKFGLEYHFGPDYVTWFSLVFFRD